ncbi:HNH endonuclease [Luteococcus sp. OSA5]|uniref:HNH endonuclease n=1 Tax=Luteococcus sp. OSA5 TaxID=3401630 RepID=UPI003B42FBFA
MQSEERRRLPALTNTNRELYLYSGNQCAFPGCAEVLLKPNGTWNCQAAHIYGVEKDAARGEHSLSNEALRAPANLILLCPNHHVEIDNKDLEGEYSVERVERMKDEHEARFRTAMVSLDRIIDSTVGVVVKRPENMRALAGFDTMDEEETRENLVCAAPFVDAIAKQPPSLRDVITLIMVHGRPEPRVAWGRDAPVAAPVAKVEGAAQITRGDLASRVKALESDGLVEIEADEGPGYFVLNDPTAKSIGWDLFASLHELAAGDRYVIERVIDHLDFTALDA